MDIIGGSNQTEEQARLKKMMKMVTAAIVILLVVCIGLGVYMYYVQSTQLKVTIDGQIKKIPENFFLFEGDKVYVPIRAFAEYVGYSSYSGDYKQYAEDTTKCYVQSTNEVASFSLNSNKIYKTILNGENDYEYFEIDEPVKSYNGNLYTTIDGAKIAFNIAFTYKNNKIEVYTLPYLVSHYTNQFQNAAIADDEADFSNQKALLYNMIVVQNADKNYGVYSLTNKEILGTKYADIKFIESTKEFIVTTMEKKMGIMSYDSTTKIKPEYESIKQIDKDAKLYLVTNNKKQGVVNDSGNVVLYLEYDQIGVDATKYSANNIKNQYLLFDNCIPVSINKKWGVYSKTGKEIIPVKYDNLGCSTGNTANNDKTTNSILVIPEYEAIVVNEGTLYGIIDKTGKQLIQNVLQSVYSVTTAGKDVYYMIYNNQVMNVIDYLDKYVKNQNNNQNNENANDITGNTTTPNNNVTGNEINQNNVNIQNPQGNTTNTNNTNTNNNGNAVQ